MYKHILLTLLAVGLLGGCAKQSNADDLLKLPNINYKSSSYYDSPFCQDFLKRAQSDKSDIQIIQPLFETNDIHDTRLKPFLENCDLTPFEKGIEQDYKQLPVGENGEMVGMLSESGNIYEIVKEYAVYPLKKNNDGVVTDFIIYKGPYFKINSDNKTRKYLNHGVFMRIYQPSCKVSARTVVHLLQDKNYEYSKRNSELVVYSKMKYLFIQDNQSNLLDLMRLEANGFKQKCSFYHVK